MIARIYVSTKKDSRRRGLLKSWARLGLSGKVSDVKLLDCYLLDGDLNKENIARAANTLENKVLESCYINKTPKGQYNFVLEIGYLPGVTDNVGHTAREAIADALHLPEKTKLDVYSSKVFLISGKLKDTDIRKIAASLHNPLIERAVISKNKELALEAPKVVLPKRMPVIKVSLNIPNEDLIKMGREGIRDENADRRGPLALGLPEMRTIKEYFDGLGRMPNDIELESLAQTWSEHCKHTIFASPIDEVKEGLYKTYIKGATNEIRKKKGTKDFCVSVFSDNAGGIAFDENYLITHKVETHNTPSALDPFGGAITGIVGVNRDTIGFGLGAKPVANLYGFCFGLPEEHRPLYRDKNKKEKLFPPKRILEGVVRGINVGGNCSGIPTVSGFVRYDGRYRGKPLVFAGTVGLIPRKTGTRLSHEKKAEAGDYIVMIGGRVGADGIHGATFSSEVMDTHSPSTAVQIGDPITQKKLSDAITKEARAMNLFNSITDNGAGGLSCSVSEMAKESGGAYVELEKVPLKYPGLRPWEIWISESQERMTLAIPKKKWRVFSALMQSRGVEATVIGEFTSSGKCVVSWEGSEIMNISLEFLHDGWPKKNLRTAPPVKNNPAPKLPKKISLSQDLEKMLVRHNIESSAFISEQYDHEVQAGSVLKPVVGPGRINTDAQVFRPVLSSEKGVVLSYGLHPSYGDVDTYHMAGAAIDTAVRNTICAGGKLSHLAILDNFCWCSSDEKTRLRELKDAVKSCYEYATSFGTPFISGKDSMYNDFNGYDERGNKIKISVPPTLLISAVSVMPDLYKATSPEFKKEGDIIYLLGETKDELGGSEYYRMHGGVGQNVPQVNAEKNMRIYSLVEKAIEEGLLASAMSLSLGGLGVALAKACIGGMLGAEISLETSLETNAYLFSESQGRVLASVPPRKQKDFEKMIKRIPHVRLGEVKGNKLIIKKDRIIISTPVKKLHNLYHNFSNTMK